MEFLEERGSTNTVNVRVITSNARKTERDWTQEFIEADNIDREIVTFGEVAYHLDKYVKSAQAFKRSGVIDLRTHSSNYGAKKSPKYVESITNINLWVNNNEWGSWQADKGKTLKDYL